MVIERTDTEIIIRQPSYVNTDNLQRLIDYLSYQETISRSKATQAYVDELAKKAKKGWWAKNKKRLTAK